MSDQAPKKNPLSLPTAADRNGPPPAGTALRDRVRSLRLSDQVTQGGGGRGGWLPWVLALLFAASTLYLGYQILTAPPPGDTAKSEADRLIEEQIKPGQGPAGEVVFESKGNVVPFDQKLISPLVGGILKKFDIFEGKKVKKDDVLGQIDDTEYRADYLNAKARLAEAEARLEEMVNGSRAQEIRKAAANLERHKALLAQRRSEFDRNVAMSQRKGVVANTDFEKAKGDFETQMAEVEYHKEELSLMVEGVRREKIDAARATVEQLKSEVVKHKKRLDDCTVKAPITGTILTKKTSEGNFVNPVGFNLSASLCEMADLTDLEIDLTVQEREISKVQVGQKCRIRPDAYPNRIYHGEVSRIMPIADRGKGAVPVRVKVFVPADEEQGRYLKPEMSVFVSFLRVEKDSQK